MFVFSFVDLILCPCWGSRSVIFLNVFFGCDKCCCFLGGDLSLVSLFFWWSQVVLFPSLFYSKSFFKSSFSLYPTNFLDPSGCCEWCFFFMTGGFFDVLTCLALLTGHFLTVSSFCCSIRIDAFQPRFLAW